MWGNVSGQAMTLSESVPQSRHSRRGFTLLELTVTLILLGVVLAMLVPLLKRIDDQRAASRQRVVALQETANILERFSARGFTEITQQAADAIEVPPRLKAALHEPRLRVSVREGEPDPGSKALTVELTWKGRAGEARAPARLTTIVYQQPESP